jgi:class 3 adenylate cyclase
MTFNPRCDLLFLLFAELCVILCLLCFLCLLTHLSLVAFGLQFENFAKQVMESTENKANRKFRSLTVLSKTITSHVRSADMNWPLVSIPDFEVRTGEFRELAEAELIAFAPIVPKEEKKRWEAYAVKEQGWIQEGLDFQGLGDVSPGMIADQMYPFSDEVDMTQDQELFVPLWQMGRAPTNASIVMMDLHTHPSFKRMIADVLAVDHILLSEVVDLDFLMQYSTDTEAADDLVEQPRSYVLAPVFDTFQDNATVVGFLIAVLPWESYFTDILPVGTNGIVVDVEDTCGSNFTYDIYGPRAEYHGSGGLYDPKFEYLRQSCDFAVDVRYDGEGNATSTEHCEYTFNIYPSIMYRKSFESSDPLIFALVVAGVFFFTAAVFVMYDQAVQRRQHKVLSQAKRTTAIIASLFPEQVGKRLIEEAVQNEGSRSRHSAAKSQLKSFLADDSQMVGDVTSFKSKPIADLFPETTIIFADIVGFTAWSSMREPSQVFTLLETIYHEFDEIAKRRGVFKVETVGDCYVAVVGLPDPRKDHHVVMARFARDCLYKFGYLTKKLEVLLGPDTTELGLRVGIHSGPVTAGVLRGERARFQLFGDTVNTTARVESTGMKNMIHISHETAELLKGSGKGHWVTPREEMVVAKGKGEMQTYFLYIKGDSAKSTASGTSESYSGDGGDGDDVISEIAVAVPKKRNSASQDATDEEPVLKTISEKQQRLVNWNSDVMGRLLREIVALREASGDEAESEVALKALEDTNLQRETLVIEEVEEVVTLPVFNAKAAKNQKDPQLVDLGESVIAQLHDYVAIISAMYQENPFHNFEHASHVTMSTVKLLARIVAPDLKDTTDEDDVGKNLHDHTYGITSDPLTQFACVFAALIHDVDHPGVPNTQLIKENTKVAAIYKNKSVAEQNSVDLAWDLLMDDAFIDLRRCIYKTESEFKRFRELVVNAVMATDIMDKDLKAKRNRGWELAFNESHDDSEADAINRKATIVIAHLIQASDVAHTMQHWHIYRKWNERLFSEMYKAYDEGRAETNPADNWYKGEIGFFDFYIIPLAKKLKDCGVFGVASEEYLNYAEQNRREWERRGQEIVAEMIHSLNPNCGTSTVQTGLSKTPEQKSSAARPA